MSCRPDANASIRDLLVSRRSDKSSGQRHPATAQVWLWQMGVVYLMCSVAFMVAGMLMLVWAAAGGEDWWNGQAQLAITFTVVAALVGGLFCWEQANLFSWGGGKEEEGDGRVRLS
jgi:hypothetical protein